MNFMTPLELADAHDAKTSEAEAFEERAAMIEHLADKPRDVAEEMARPMAAKFCHHMNLYALRMQAVRLAARNRMRRSGNR
jgi:hypothetical protein